MNSCKKDPVQYQVEYYVDCQSCDIVYYDANGLKQDQNARYDNSWTHTIIANEGQTVGFVINSRLPFDLIDEVIATLKVDEQTVKEIQISAPVGDTLSKRELVITL